MQVMLLGAIYDVDDVGYRVPDQLSANFSTSPVDVDTVAIDIPTAPMTAIGVCIQIDPTTNAISYKQGAAFPATLTHKQAFDAGYYPQRDTDQRRITWLRLVTGMTAISYEHLYNAPELLNGGGGGGSDVDGVQVYWLGKHGNDANSGLTWNDAVLTIGQAHTLTAAETPATDNRFAIVCLDAGIYDEDVTCQEWVDLYMPNATIEGAIVGAVNCRTRVHCNKPDAAAVGFELNAGSGLWQIDVDWIELTTNSIGIYGNVALASILAHVGKTSIADGASGTTALHIDSGKMYVDFDYIGSNVFYDVAGATTLYTFGRMYPTGTRTSAGTVYEINPYQFQVAQMVLNGYTITDISNDTTLADDATDELVTEHAVKTYVDNYVARAIVADHKTNGTNGGTFTTGAKRTRDLNTKEDDPSMICSIEKLEISSGGTYVITIGDIIEGDTSGTTATVWALENVAGSFAGGDWEGYLWLEDDVTGAFTPTETLHVGAEPNVATVDADATNNQVRLKSGYTYRVKAKASASRVGNHKAFWEDVTNTVTIAESLNGYSAASGNYETSYAQFVSPEFTLAADTTYELQHICSNTYATYGFGWASSLGTYERYSEVEIYRKAS
jgi:hypothetical protein